MVEDELAPHAQVKTGKSYPLAVTMDKRLPVFRHRSFNLYTLQAGPLGPNKLTFIDELVNPVAIR